MQLSGDEIYIENFFLSFGSSIVKILLECHGLAEERRDSVQDNINELIVYHFGIHNEFINIVQVFLNSTYLFEIINLVKSPI